MTAATKKKAAPRNGATFKSKADVTATSLGNGGSASYQGDNVTSYPHDTTDVYNGQGGHVSDCQEGHDDTPFLGVRIGPDAGNEAEAEDVDRNSDPSYLPVVVVTSRQNSAIASDYIAAMDTANRRAPWIFQQDRRIVYVRGDQLGAHYLESVDERACEYILSRVARTVERAIVKKKPQLVDTAVPTRFTRIIPKCVALPFPRILAFSSTPVIRADGTIVTTPGYDEQSQVYYDPSPRMELTAIADNPSRIDAEQAARKILDLFADFPFVTRSDKANTLAYGLTRLLRHAIDGCVPMVITTATSGKGTGKGLLFNLLSIMTTGEELRTRSLPDEEAEIRKTITSVAMAGQTSVVFDNVRGTIASESLEAAITTRFWEDRLLGTNQQSIMPLNCTWAATGNGVQLGGDMPRRAYFIHLDAEVSNAYERGTRSDNDFRIADISGYTKSHQGEYLSAFLTMIRAWYAGGCPAGPLTVFSGSFHQWSQIIAGVLAYANVPGFLENARQEAQDMDTESQEWEAFLLAISEQHNDTAFTVKEIVAGIDLLSQSAGLGDYVPGALASALDRNHSAISRATSLGKFFRNRLGRRFGGSGIRIIDAGQLHHISTFRVVTDETRIVNADAPAAKTAPAPDTMSTTPAPAIAASTAPRESDTVHTAPMSTLDTCGDGNIMPSSLYVRRYGSPQAMPTCPVCKQRQKWIKHPDPTFTELRFYHVCPACVTDKRVTRESLYTKKDGAA